MSINADIINSSIRQGIVSFEWKLSYVNPLAETFPPVSVENDVKPMAITNTLAKISERFVSKLLMIILQIFRIVITLALLLQGLLLKPYYVLCMICFSVQ
jgi:hypothetical protein